MAVEVRVLGPLEVVHHGAAVRVPPAERTLLAVLASRLGERVAVDGLAEALWPDGAPPSARKTVQAHIARLRRAVGAPAIVERDGGYLLDPDVVSVDAARAASLIAAGRDALRACDAAAAVGLLTEATGLFRGEPYEGIADEALPAGEMTRIHELRLSIAEEIAEAQLASGSGEHSVAELEALVQANPYRERAWALLMRALYQAGRPADALGAYGRARVVLAAELGIEPGPALREIEQAILTHDAALGGATVATPRLGAANLPTPVSPLIGRDLELAALLPFARGQRLLTLTGVGGIGKTRLAIEIAGNATGRSGYGPYFVDLSAIRDVELVTVALAAALGIDVEPGADVNATIRSAVGDRAFVIVVDNCEHLLPRIADVVAVLVASSPNVEVVATSREPLGVAGERVCPLDPLGVPPAAASVEQIETSDAAALFLARLPMNLTTAPLSADELAAVGAICRHLDGIPLGLELAAARSRTLSLPDLADRLGQSIDELEPSRHGVPPRHRTMRAALDWGYRLLSPRSQSALRAMSVFAGGCDVDAFTTICTDDDDTSVIDILDELVRTSFVNVDFTTSSTRYRLLEPVRQHAHQLLDEHGETVIRHHRHLEHYLAYARDHTSDVDRLGFTTDLDALRTELGNFRVALDWAAAHPDASEHGLWLVARLFDVWEQDAHHEEGLARTQALLRIENAPAAARSEAAYCACFIANSIGDWPLDQALNEQAFAIARAGGDLPGEARARRLLAGCALTHGDIAAAVEHSEIAMRIARDEDNAFLLATCTNSLVELLWATGRLDEAERLLSSRLDTVAVQDAVIEIPTRSWLGRILYERGDYSGARASNARILDRASADFNLTYVLSANLDLVTIECAADEPDAASCALARAEALQPDAPQVWDCLFTAARANLALLTGNDAQALVHAERARALDPDGISWGSYEWRRPLGDAQLALGHLDDAGTTFQQLADVVAALPCRRAEAYEGAAATAAALGDTAGAHHHLAVAAELRRSTGSRRIRRRPVEQHLARLEHDRVRAPVTGG